jgi:Spy/CpxP family protein refolding chaperone
MNEQHSNQRNRSTTHKVIVTIAASATLIVGAAAISWAAGDGGYHGHGHAGDATGGAAMGRGGMGGKFMLRALDRHLDLSDDQRVAIEAIVDASRTEGTALRQQMHATFEQIRSSVEQEGYDEDRVRILIENEAPQMVDMMLLRIRTLADIRAQLTPEQQATAAELFASRRGKFMR